MRNPSLTWPSKLGLQNILTASLHSPKECPGYDTEQSDGEALRMLEYPYIAM